MRDGGPPDTDAGTAVLVRRFFSGTSTSYDRVSSLCTLGADRWWKARMLARIRGRPERVLDQACGTGILTFMIARRFPSSRIVGVDVTEEYLEVARRKAARLGVTNVEFVLGRAEEASVGEAFGCITSSYLAKYADLGALIGRAHAQLRPGGILIMHDFTYPSHPVVAHAWDAYLGLLQTHGARRYPAWKPAFDGLPGLVKGSRWVEESLFYINQNGFAGITVTPLTLGCAAIVSAIKL